MIMKGAISFNMIEGLIMIHTYMLFFVGLVFPLALFNVEVTIFGSYMCVCVCFLKDQWTSINYNL